jgi:hypothetical protein
MTQSETLWGGYEEENLTHETADEAIEAIIDDWDPPDDKTIVVWEYRRKELPSVDYIRDGLIDWLRDDFDSEYGNPDEENEVPNEVYIAAERFAQVVRREWQVWTMERTENKIEANVGEWKRKNP